MKIFTIKNIGKFFFWLSFILGSICLFGYVFTCNEDFAFNGFLVLIYGTLINIIVFLGLILYGIFNPEKTKECNKSAFILLINVPIAFLYIWIGLSIL